MPSDKILRQFTLGNNGNPLSADGLSTAGTAASWPGMPMVQSLLNQNLFGLDQHAGNGTQVVFVDPGLGDLQTLLSTIKTGTDVILLDSRRDALDQIGETLAGQHGITSVHIITHGMARQIDFSSGALALGHLTTGSHPADLAALGHALATQNDLMLWSCDTGPGAEGQSFIDALSQHTGADVAASTEPTSAGANWRLEAPIGHIESHAEPTNHGMPEVNTDGLDLSGLRLIYTWYTPNTSGGNYAYRYAGNSELGFSDGTLAGTYFDELFPGKGPTGPQGGSSYNDSTPTNFTRFGDKVAFVATDATHGRELWVTDGTSAGTYNIADIWPGGDAFPAINQVGTIPMEVIGTELYFAANDGSHGIELWKTDGTAGNASMVKDLNPGSGSSYVGSMVDFGGTLFFAASDGTKDGSEPVSGLWKSDGTSGGTSQIFTLYTGASTYSAPSVFGLTVSGNHLFFVGNDGTGSGTSNQIYVSDGTTTQLLDPAVVSHGNGPLTDVNGTLYYELNDGTHGNQLWTSDGTAAGTQMVTNLTDFAASNFVAGANGETFFLGRDDVHGYELWETDGTGAGTQLVKDINPTGDGASSDISLTVIGHEAYFVAYPTGSGSAQIWETDGTAANTQAVDPGSGITSPRLLQNINGTLYFAANGTDNTLDIFKLSGGSFVEVANNVSTQNTGAGTIGGFTFLGGGVVGEPDAFTTDEATAVTGGNLFNDNGSGPDTGGSLSIAEVNGSSGNVGHQTTLASGALLTVNSDGTFVYDPNGAFDDLPSATSGASNLTASDTFTYTLTGASSATTVTVTIDGLDSNDLVIGTNGTDTLNPGRGEDTVLALAGADSINMRARLDANDKIDGGSGTDTVILRGDYSAGVVFNATTMVNVENIRLSIGYSYKLVVDNATVASGQTLTVLGSALGSSDKLTFNGSLDTTGGNFIINSGAGNDALTGGAGDDVFHSGSGNDTIHGGGGNDTISMGALLNAADSIDGGAGLDTVSLAGDYSGGVTFNATTMTNVETLSLSAGHSYRLTIDNATVAAGQTLTVQAGLLGAADSVIFDGSADTTGGRLVIDSGAGNDTLTGGADADTFRSGAGNDSISGGGGADTINMGAFLNAADSIDGGSGTDKVLLNGDYSGGVTFNATTMANIESISLSAGHSYKLTMNNATVAAGHTLTVQGTSLGAADSLNFNGSADKTGGNFILNGGAGADTLIGGVGKDVINGGDGNNIIWGAGGADQLYGGSGSDRFVYNAVADSTGINYDGVHGFDANADSFKFTGFAVNAIDSAVSGDLSRANFDSSLAANVGAGQLGAHHAVLFTATSGGLSGDVFLVVDANGTAGYQAGQDFVIDITGATHLANLTTANFTH